MNTYLKLNTLKSEILKSGKQYYGTPAAQATGAVPFRCQYNPGHMRQLTGTEACTLSGLLSQESHKG